MTDDRLAAIAERERREIVAKYKLGREEGATVDPWEDPDFEVYHVTDRYGFMHKGAVPKLPSATEAKLLQTERERTSKWWKMLQKWESFYPGEKVRKRIYKGIPDALRGFVWSRLLEIDRIKAEQVGVYETMKERAHEWSPDIRQIDLDVNRTYRDHIMFRKRYDVKQQALFHVLAAYSMYNTEVGYCQGMSQIAALLLMYLNEEDSFWALSALLSHKRHTMHGFFIPGFPKLIRFQEHHNHVLEKLLPRVKKHLDKNELHATLYSIKWFMQCFLDRVPFTMCLRLWDIYMLQGERLLVAMSYNMLKMHQRRLVKMSQEQLMGFFQGDLVNNFGYDNDETIASLVACEAELQRARLELPPPASDASEYPTQPFGLFVPPSVQQVIGRRTIETETELIGGRDRRTALRRNSRMSISIPPDGGPARLESVDMAQSPPTLSSDRLRSAATVDESDKAGKYFNGSGVRSQSLGDRQSSSSSAAGQRRADFAKTRGNTPAAAKEQPSNSNNGSFEEQKQNRQPEANISANGNASFTSLPASDAKLGRPKSINRKSVKIDRMAESDLVAPQHYGATVRL